MVKTPCRTVEQPASLSLIVPPATRQVRARRLRPVMIKPRLASRPLLQPALPSPLTFLACLLHLWPDPPPLLSCLLLFEQYLLSLRSSTHLGCIQTMLNAGLSRDFCVNIIMPVLGFRLYLLFILWLFPLPPFLVAAFLAGQLLCSLWLGKGLAVWEGKYSSFFRL